MKIFDDAFRTILCAQAFVKAVFGVQFHIRRNFVLFFGMDVKFIQLFPQINTKR